MIWLYAVLAIIIAVAIWLAVVVIKWLFILAVAANRTAILCTDSEFMTRCFIR
jgi:hypothetical protein